jgi:predicted ester cyclase
MSVEENKDTVRSIFAAMDSEQNMAGPLEKFGAPHYQAHFNGMPSMDAASMAGFAQAFFDACPGLRHDLEELVGEGDKVSLKMTIRGTHTQPFMMPNGALPASGKAFEMPVMNLFRFDSAGKVDEHWATFDMLGFLQQIGAAPGQ